MTKDEWESTLKKADIQKSSVDRKNSTEWISTETVTTIGRTLLTVESSYQFKSRMAESSLSIAYKVNENETKFIQSMADDEIKLEQVLVLYDTMNANNGKLTKEGLKSAGLEYHAGLFGSRFFDNISSIESVYHLSQKGLSAYEAELKHQQARESFTSILGLAAFRSVSGGGYTLQPMPAKVTPVKVSKPAPSNTATSGKSNPAANANKPATGTGDTSKGMGKLHPSTRMRLDLAKVL